jgi:hypothetical protein
MEVAQVSSMLRTGRVSMVIRRLVHHRSVGREAPKEELGDPRWVPSSKVDGQVGEPEIRSIDVLADGRLAGPAPHQCMG